MFLRSYRRYLALHLNTEMHVAWKHTTCTGTTFELTRLRYAQGYTEYIGRVSPSDAKFLMMADDLRLPVSATENGIWKLALPGNVRNASLETTDDEALQLPALGRRQISLAHLRETGRFFKRLATIAPLVPGWLSGRKPKHREAIKTLLGFNPYTATGRLDRHLVEAISGASPDTVYSPPPGQRFYVIVPVYNALACLKECLSNLIQHTHGNFHILICDDASTDGEVWPFLQKFRSDLAEPVKSRVTIFRNDENLGFIRTVNRCLGERAGNETGPVILLNSDAIVPDAWAERLLAPFEKADRIGSVTPFSNDAELQTVPVLCAPGPVTRKQAEHIDKMARRLPERIFDTDVMTGVGFCFAMSSEALAIEPHFDPAFGDGYGEEVDWCQKVRKAGFRHLATPRLFVEHRSGSSFGKERKTQLLRKNGRLIAKRYPTFDAEVQRFIAKDPLIGPRFALALGWLHAQALERQSDVPVYLAHHLGGGAEMVLLRSIAYDCKDGTESSGGALVIRVGGPARFRLELHSPTGITAVETEEADLIDNLLNLLGAHRLIYSCAVGDPDPLGLTDHMIRWAKTATNFDILFHDYFPLSPSFTLLDAAGSYSGNIPLTLPKDHMGGSLCTPKMWQQAWHPLLCLANQLVVFSADSAKLVRATYPDLASKIVIRPHSLEIRPKLVEQSRALRRPVLGVLGNINFHKGAEIVLALAKRCNARRIGLVLVGALDPKYTMRYGNQTGPYRTEDISLHAMREEISAWFIPSIWPETFSFTTHEAIATGLPVGCFAIGAQADAIRASLLRGGDGSLIELPSLSKMTTQDTLDAIIDGLITFH